MSLMVASEESFVLGEGPVWDAPRSRLLWVDIEAGLVLAGELGSDGRIEVRSREAFDATVGAVAVAEDATLLVAAHDRLVVVTPEGTRQPGARVVPDGEQRRMNDGKTDPAGRFLVGTLSLTGPTHRDVLCRLEPDGSLAVLDDDLMLSNGLGWSADGTRFYSTDTLDRVIWVRDYDVASGAVGERRALIRFDDGAGMPDGLCVDAEEHLWVAVWGAGEVRRYTPDGVLTRTLAVPAPHTTSVAFAGAGLDTLVITTASTRLSEEQLRANPDSGRLFTARVGVRGLPVAPWSGVSASRG